MAKIKQVHHNSRLKLVYYYYDPFTIKLKSILTGSGYYCQNQLQFQSWNLKISLTNVSITFHEKVFIFGNFSFNFLQIFKSFTTSHNALVNVIAAVTQKPYFKSIHLHVMPMTQKLAKKQEEKKHKEKEIKQ